jgi:hypothetical protein
MPNLQHTCINKIDLSNNLLSSKIHLVLSKYTIYFMDYLNLQSNNITYIKLIDSEQKFKQDKYEIQNSPRDFFYARANTTIQNHTTIDLKLNRNFQCDCELSRAFNNYQHIKLMHESCSFDGETNECTSTTAFAINSLNLKLKILFFGTFSILILLSFVIIYHTCYDCIWTTIDQSKNKVFYRVFNLRFLLSSRFRPQSAAYSSNSNQIYTPAGQNHNLSSIGVQYSKLVEDEVTASQLELNS